MDAIANGFIGVNELVVIGVHSITLDDSRDGRRRADRLKTPRIQLSSIWVV